MTYEVFINYRTGDGDKTAALLEENLGHRFGKEHVFRASNAIPPGATYPEALITAVRRSGLVLAVIGPSWSKHPRLHTEDDWVRTEIQEALTCGIEVIPILDGRMTERLDPADLPVPLQRLADVQSIRLDAHDLPSGLKRIGDVLAAKLPRLKAADRTPQHQQEPEVGGVRNTIDEARGNLVQAGNFIGDAGMVSKGNHGPTHFGSGDINQHSPHISGAGAIYVARDNRGGIRQKFGDTRDEEEKDDKR
ncbi:toll/interleukin-1 receptor domain-containing protein [Nonomuraea sp. NPDC050310]|uniref:toll/interleukin-1 receptor domain-containing protein n=1 Tax=Nonomuraea sp. NPDC050310 TaxID=3154935 RepID=UPI0033D86E9C